jgi:hypothetical protein
MKVCNFLAKFFLFLSFSFISFFNLSASCIKVEDTSFVFLSQDDNECDDKSGTGILTIPNGGVNNFDVLIPGKNDGGYTIELVFDRAGQSSISGEQSLFAFYSSADDINPVSELILKGSSIFYKVNDGENEGIDLSKDLNDPNIVNPHTLIIVHDNIKDQLILNIDGAELEIENVPSINASDIKNVKIGKNYVGNIGEFRVYGTELAINERAGAVKLLSGMTGAKISVIELVKDKNGVKRSAVDKVDFVKCKAGQAIINGNCNNAVISGFTPPSNTTYSGVDDIQYDPLHNGQANAKELECETGYEKGPTPPKYWFVLDGDVPSVYTEGSCVARDYSDKFGGIDNLGNLALVTYSDSGNSLLPLPCKVGYSSHEDAGYKFDNETGDITIVAGGGCVSLGYPIGLPNPNFEEGSKGWTATGTAFNNWPMSKAGNTGGVHNGTYSIYTHQNGEDATGTLKSDPFIIDGNTLSWYAGGFGNWGNGSYHPGADSGDLFSYLAVDIGDDGTNDIIKKSPGEFGYGSTGDGWFSQSVDLSEHQGKIATIKLVDNDFYSGYAWSAWDSFHIE